jgi:hypothetical protein
MEAPIEQVKVILIAQILRSLHDKFKIFAGALWYLVNVVLFQ